MLSSTAEHFSRPTNQIWQGHWPVASRTRVGCRPIKSRSGTVFAISFAFARPMSERDHIFFNVIACTRPRIGFGDKILQSSISKKTRQKAKSLPKSDPSNTKNESFTCNAEFLVDAKTCNFWAPLLLFLGMSIHNWIRGSHVVENGCQGTPTLDNQFIVDCYTIETRTVALAVQIKYEAREISRLFTL